MYILLYTNQWNGACRFKFNLFYNEKSMNNAKLSKNFKHSRENMITWNFRDQIVLNKYHVSAK